MAMICRIPCSIHVCVLCICIYICIHIIYVYNIYVYIYYIVLHTPPTHSAYCATCSHMYCSPADGQISVRHKLVVNPQRIHPATHCSPSRHLCPARTCRCAEHHTPRACRLNGHGGMVGGGQKIESTTLCACAHHDPHSHPAVFSQLLWCINRFSALSFCTLSHGEAPKRS